MKIKLNIYKDTMIMSAIFISVTGFDNHFSMLLAPNIKIKIVDVTPNQTNCDNISLIILFFYVFDTFYFYPYSLP